MVRFNSPKTIISSANALRRCVAVALLCLSALGVVAQEVKSEYMPVISGVVRGRWEINTESGDNRFAIRNARLKVSGKIAQPIDYFFQADVCQLGKFDFLDVWMRLKASERFSVRVGQFRIPFAVDPFRGPASYYFANRSFIGRDGANLRSVGFSLSYKFAKIPLLLEGGVFNNTPITEHSTFNQEKVYAGKASLKMGDYFTLVGSFESIMPGTVRMNLADAALIYDYGRWHAEAEYVNIHYTNSAFDACNAYNVFANYWMPVDAGVFKELSFQGRWEGSDPYCNGKPNGDGALVAAQPERKRLTLGSTLTYRQKGVRCDVRLNYEKYFYNSGQVAPTGREDKVCAEVVVVF